MLERLKGLLPLNWELLGNPVNWAIIVLMVLLAGVMLHYILADDVMPAKPAS